MAASPEWIDCPVEAVAVAGDVVDYALGRHLVEGHALELGRFEAAHDCLPGEEGQHRRLGLAVFVAVSFGEEVVPTHCWHCRTSVRPAPSPPAGTGGGECPRALRDAGGGSAAGHRPVGQ